MCVPVEESVAENNYCKTNSALNRGNLTEFEYDSDRAIPDTPPPERKQHTRLESAEPRADLHMVTGTVKTPQRQQSLDTTLPIETNTIQPNNPIDQLAMALEKIAANKAPTHQTLLQTRINQHILF